MSLLFFLFLIQINPLAVNLGLSNDKNKCRSLMLRVLIILFIESHSFKNLPFLSYCKILTFLVSL